MFSKNLAMLLGTALLMSTWPGCGGEPSEKSPGESQVLAAKLQTVESVRLPSYAVLPGTVVSADRVEVASRLTGYVYDLKVHEGQAVKKGQPLFAVNPTEVEAEIRKAKAEVAKAKASLSDASENYKHYKALYQQHAATGQRYREIEMEYKVAVGNYQAAEAALVSARTQLKYAQVTAPFDGLVVSRLADNGQLTASGTPVLVLEDPNRLQVQVHVDQQAFAHLKLGQEIRVQFQGPGFETHPVTGTVQRLVMAANPVTHTHLVKIGLPAGTGSYTGEYALVNIPVGELEGIVVPEEAVQDRAGILGVFVVDAQGRAQFRMVTLGKRLPQGRVILSGLFPGDRVVLSTEGPLFNGVKISGGTGAKP
jgi:multidrug efflux system membrane fusion protein